MTAARTVTKLKDLDDVFGTPTDGQIPVWNAAHNRFEYANFSGPASGGGTLQGKSGATIAALGAGDYDGQPGLLKPAGLSDSEILYWHSLQGQWKSRAKVIAMQLDQNYMGAKAVADWEYIGTPVSGSAASNNSFAGGILERSLFNARQYMLAGCKVEHRWHCLCYGNLANLYVFSIVPFFWNYSSGDQAPLSTNGASAIAEGQVIQSNAESIPSMKATVGWLPISKKGAAGTPLEATDLAKDHLTPRFYGKMSAGPGTTIYGAVIDIGLEVRYSS